MGGIDKIRKINEMSATLRQHGFAASSDDAASKAQDVFKEKIADVEKSEVKMADDKDIAKLERNFEVFKSTTHKQLSSLREDVHSVIEKMNQIIKAINELEKLKDSVTTIDEGKEKQKRLAPKIVKKPKEQKNQRTGDMKPGDVDLSETFYYGTR
jgi:glutamine synthetase adenylyltransferase